MSLKSRVSRAEDTDAFGGRRPLSIETATDAELETIIADALGIDEDEITDELLESVARGGYKYRKQN